MCLSLWPLYDSFAVSPVTEILCTYCTCAALLCPALCSKWEAGGLFGVVPLLMLGHLSGLASPDVEHGLLASMDLILFIFAARKYTQASLPFSAECMYQDALESCMQHEYMTVCFVFQLELRCCNTVPVVAKSRRCNVRRHYTHSTIHGHCVVKPRTRHNPPTQLCRLSRMTSGTRVCLSL